MIYDLLAPLQGPGGGGAGPKCSVARPTHVSNLHNKFGWISSNGLGGDSVTDGRADGRRRLQYLHRCGDYLTNGIQTPGSQVFSTAQINLGIRSSKDHLCKIISKF